MRLTHRKVHRYVWSLFLPLLFIAVLLLSNTSIETMPVNASVPGLEGDTGSDENLTLIHRILP